MLWIKYAFGPVSGDHLWKEMIKNSKLWRMEQCRSPLHIISQFFLIAPQLILAPVEYLILVMYADKSAKHLDQKCAKIQKFIPDSSAKRHRKQRTKKHYCISRPWLAVNFSKPTTYRGAFLNH